MNLFCYRGPETDAVALYRDTQPIGHLRRIVPLLNLFFPGPQVKMTDLAHIDIAYIRRPYLNEHIQFLNMCREFGVKTWIDYDDNLFEVPNENKAQSVYGNKETKDLLIQIARSADVISVSTKQLAKDIEETCGVQRVKVIPNAFNDFIFTDIPFLQKHNLACWRGSDTHQKDLGMYGAEIVNVAQANPNWLFNFMGYHPWFLTEHFANHKFTPAMEIMKYHRVLKQTYPNIMMIPLTDNKFNRCKSNIAFIEATYAGAVCLAPQWEEWTHPGVTTYNNPEDFGKNLSHLIGAKEEVLQKAHTDAWEYIDQNLRLSKVNRLRAQLLQELKG